MDNLEKLLEKASRLFRKKDWVKAKLTSYDFCLNKMPYGWKFQVINNWHKWMDKNLETDFGCYSKPEYAVLAFLDYVKDHKINVKKLMDK